MVINKHICHKIKILILFIFLDNIEAARAVAKAVLEKEKKNIQLLRDEKINNDKQYSNVSLLFPTKAVCILNLLNSQTCFQKLYLI